MSSRLRLWFAIIILCLVGCTNKSSTQGHSTSDWPDSFEFGETVSQSEIDSVDFDVRPDGKGLPKGSGSFADGRSLYAARCAQCHGKNGFEGPFNPLVQNDTIDNKTIGNYWPYATTVYDYIKRAMPFDKPGTLTDDEVYALTTYLLARNNVIDSTVTLDETNLAKVHMPAQSRYVDDDRTGGSVIR